MAKPGVHEASKMVHSLFQIYREMIVRRQTIIPQRLQKIENIPVSDGSSLGSEVIAFFGYSLRELLMVSAPVVFLNHLLRVAACPIALWFCEERKLAATLVPLCGARGTVAAAAGA